MTEHTQALEDFLADLAAFALPGCFNPWGETCSFDTLADAPKARRERLRAHFANPAIEVLLVGEAPGYQGCRYSGMAFTSEKLLLNGAIPGVPWPLGRITSRPTPWSEPSATIVWGSLHRLGVQRKVGLWNALPIHPFRQGEPHSNRTPTADELAAGGVFLRRLIEEVLPRGVGVVAIGTKAATTFKALGLEGPTIRHPANGGATAFRLGVKDLFDDYRESAGRLPFEEAWA